MRFVAVLFRNPKRDPRPPEELAMGRAALALRKEEIVAVFGSEVDKEGNFVGDVAIPGGWERRVGPIDAVYDRYPCQSHPEAFAALQSNFAVPWVNAPELVVVCRDKLETQRLLESHVDMPPVTDVFSEFEARLADWGAGFVKPRYGAFGIGVRRVGEGSPLTPTLRGVTAVPEPTLLQHAVRPLAPYAGVSVRVNVQRDPGGAAVLNPPVARRSETDPVVNAARGAGIVPARDILGAGVVDAICAMAMATFNVMVRRWGAGVAELGVDIVVGHDEKPWLIEVNSKPRGRLAALAARWPDRFEEVHLQTTTRPIRYAASLVPG